MAKLVDLTGKKFNKLTVVGIAEPPETRKCKDRRYWHCKCECGSSKDIIAATNEITSGHVKSCGCISRSSSRKANLTGLTFGRLTVIQEVPQPKHLISKNKIYWLCKCSCGSNKDVIKSSDALKSGNTKSCGCLSRELTSKRSKKYCTYNLTGEYGIGFTSNNKKFYFDLEDYELIKDYCWYASDNGYANSPRDSSGYRLRMHRHVMNAPDNMQVDHINHNKLDNRKSNLRLATNQQNQMNRSNVKGVYWDKNCNKWNSKIGYNGKSIDLGVYENIEDAIMARKEAEEKYFGEYSYDNSINLNKIDKE